MSGLSKRLRIVGEIRNVTGNFLIFIFLMLVKLSYTHSEEQHICQSRRWNALAVSLFWQPWLVEVQMTIRRIILIISGTETVPLQNSCQCVLLIKDNQNLAWWPTSVECPCIFATPLIKPSSKIQIPTLICQFKQSSSPCHNY